MRIPASGPLWPVRTVTRVVEDEILIGMLLAGALGAMGYESLVQFGRDCAMEAAGYL